MTCLTWHIECVWQENVNYMTYLATMYLTLKVTLNLKRIIWTITLTNTTAIFLNMEVTNYPFWDIRGCQKLITRLWDIGVICTHWHYWHEKKLMNVKSAIFHSAISSESSSSSTGTKSESNSNTKMNHANAGPYSNTRSLSSEQPKCSSMRWWVLLLLWLSL